MENPAELGVAARIKARDEPCRYSFRLYFGLAYLAVGISILLYMGK